MSSASFPLLHEHDPGGVQRLLSEAGFLEPDERVRNASVAGAGNMNLTLRVQTGHRTFIAKQARPWVHKYPQIAAPVERSAVEHAFYQAVAGAPAVAGRMPRLLGYIESAALLLLEDLAPAADLTFIYAAGAISPPLIDALADYAGALHALDPRPSEPLLVNRAMRALNHTHIFEIPFLKANGLNLDQHEPGLRAAADALAADAGALRKVAELARRYLDDGPVLLHGDYFPGSWMDGPAGLRVIDPEFCLPCDREFDLGVALAHLALARCERPAAERLLERYASGRAARLDASLLAGFAAVEVLRRLVGVAQLPIAPSNGWRAALLSRARQALFDEKWESLWAD